MEQPISRTVFVVDDDEAVRDSLRALLESYGFTVQDYPSVEAFLAGMPDQPRGCLLLDIHMPGASGIDLLEHLRAHNPTLPVIAVTGRGDPLLRERVLRLGALAFLDKPINEDILAAALSRALALIPAK